MKLPFTYKNNFFSGMLTVSVIGHGLFFMGGNLGTPFPTYGVESGPSSIEVMLLKTEPETLKRENSKEETVITVESPYLNAPKVIQQNEKKESDLKPKSIEKPVYIPPVQGALTEAKPAYLKNPAPKYPWLARQKGWEGVVHLRVHVLKDGKPLEVQVRHSSGHDILDKEAMKTVKKWIFQPSRVGALSFDSWVEIPIRFLLEDSI